ncbi:hypothetical protein TcasGA2_TC014441 [Tribolium castaneum]|uniref:Uncharacterized protein n=1 Tax=Tribolium castaneum TaxID=7070 RepID=D6WLZ5_TRICA|nr:PREDICTED: uncharacterized protein LOC103313151 [Tribolium castaneum]EFA04192.1 hypothetical protein TcasGA2_TC014441 [Tribolium castaneum]|eukprot:XP_008193885.1 PREDICTED: uncharacterized protein LOC103313151 [Tribolium castaneum]
MYYLAQFCRICIKTGVKLLDINTVDFDYVTFSEKLESCSKMVINRESLSTQICLQCVKKLRMSYDFHNMCKQSTKILQGYLTELISASNKITPESFVNSELRVTLTPICKNALKRKRITKYQRCSLLKKLLLSRKNNIRKEKTPRKKREPKSVYKGGLRGIIDFTRNFDFGYKYDGNHNNCLLSDATPLSRLHNFTNTFFLNNFAEFRNTILYIIENKDNLSESDDDDDMFDSYIPEPGEPEVKSEEVVVEPDIKIKTEYDYDDSETNFSCNYYVETSYSDSEIKKENFEVEDHPIKQEPLDYNNEPQNSVQMLDKLVGDLGQQRRAFSHHSVRCRTRGNPYINPKLKQQFQFKSFQCDKCSRYFKSPGYLKAHIAKIHH